LAKWIVAVFLSEREAAIAAFSFMLGQSLVIRGFDFYDAGASAVADVIGTAAGLVVLWWLFFGRGASHSDRQIAPNEPE